jgi:hypothetical protein
MDTVDLQHKQYRELRKGLQVLAARKGLAMIGDFQELPSTEEQEREMCWCT